MPLNPVMSVKALVNPLLSRTVPTSVPLVLNNESPEGEVNKITRSYKVCAFIRHGGNAIRLSLRSYPQGQQDN